VHEFCVYEGSSNVSQCGDCQSVKVAVVTVRVVEEVEDREKLNFNPNPNPNNLWQLMLEE
jgi:hypothetical protein